MRDQAKTKAQLMQELAGLRQQTAALEAAQERCQAAERALTTANQKLELEIAERKRVEKYLREGEQRFRTIADFTYDWEYWLSQEGVYLYVSPSCQRITGCSPEEFLQNPSLLLQLIHPDDRFLVEKHLQVELTDSREVLALDFRLITPSGEQRWVGHICQPVFDDAGQWQGRRASNRDITQRKRMEAELIKFSRAMEQTADLVMITDPTGLLEYVNPAFETLTGYTKEEVVGRKPNFVKSGHHPPQFYTNLWQTIRAGQVFRHVFVNKKRNGELYYEEKIISPVKDEQGQIRHFVSTGRDVTALRQTEQALRKSEEKFRKLFELVPIGIIYGSVESDPVDIEKMMRQAEFNNTFASILGYSPTELRRLGVSGISFAEDMAKDYTLFQELLAGKRQTYRLEKRYYHRDGALVWGELTVALVRDRNGQPQNIIGMMLDITERKRAETERTYFTNQLRTAAEISTQLTAILNIEQLLYDLVTLLQRRFNLYHVHVYLLNEAGDDLIMRVGSGEVGRLLRQRGHHIPLNQERSLVAQATRQRQLVAVDNVRLEPAFLANPLLPETHSEVAIPLIVANRVVGVLDMQDNRLARFTQADLDVFSTLAGQIAIALDNAHLFEEQKRVQQELRETKEQLEAILQGIADGITVIDTAGQLIYVNTAAAKAAGFSSPQAMLDASPADIHRKYEIMGEDGQPFPPVQLPGRLALQGVQDSAANLRFRDRSTGRERWSVVKATPIFDEQGQVKFAVTITHDITSRKQTEEALQRYAARLQTLHQIDRDILAARLPETIAQVALAHIRHMIPCSRASVVEFDFENYQAQILALHVAGETRLESQFPLSTTAYNIELLKQGHPHLTNDLEQLATPSGLEQLLLNEGIRSYVNIPLLVQGELIGSLNVGSDYPDSFMADHLDIAEEVAISLAIAIQHARLYEQAQQDADTKARLLHEVNHRVKNNLAAIVGLLYIEQNHVKNQPDCQSMVSDLIKRLEGLAAVHRLLSESQWAPLPLSEVAQQVIYSVVQTLPSDRRVVTTVSPARTVYVTPKQANSLAMVINELATNTVKYAVPTRPTVSIEVEIAQENNTILLEYRDNGPGFPVSTLQTGQGNVGLYLIKNITQSDLHGDVSFQNEAGAVVTIRFRGGG